MKMQDLFSHVFVKICYILIVCAASRCEMNLSENTDLDEKYEENFHRNEVAVSRFKHAMNKLADGIKAERNKEGVCELEVTRKSEEQFSKSVLKYKYNFVYFNITFSGVNVVENDQVIMYTRWIWTYKGEDGGSEFLLLPMEFGYLSFGLLWSYTLVKPMELNIQLKNKSHCGNLTAGGDADQIVGDALGNMTKTIAAVNDEYNSSYWCYLKRSYIKSKVLFTACANAICPIQTVEYSCCRFKINFLTNERKVVCNKEQYHFGAIWWLLPVLIGEILFAYYPLLLTLFGCRLRSFSRRRRRRSVSLQDVTIVEDSRNEYMRASKRNPPVTFMSAICEPLGRCDTEGQLLSRLIRFTIIVFPLSLTMVRIVLDYKYNGDLVSAAVAKDALLGFSSVIAGFKPGTRYFMKFFGGPFVALPLFTLFGCILIVAPKTLEKVLEEGLIEFSGKAFFFLTLSVENKAKLTGISIINTTGYKRVHRTLLSQCLLLLNRSFWIQVSKLFITRFTKAIYPTLKRFTRSSCFAKIVGFFLLPSYVVFCIIELVFSVIYFAFPVFSCFFIFIKAYAKLTREVFTERIRFNQTVALIPTIIVIVIFIYTWYMYCVIFFDSFWFLTKIVTFTYTGLIAYPKLSYGYLILGFMTLYYIGECFNGFKQTYVDLLSISIKACKTIEEELESNQTVTDLCNNGIHIDLWNLIVKRHRPKRIQVAYTLFQLFAIISILSVSLELLFRFEKFRELSLIIHVFTALVICALPKIIKSMCTDHGQRHRKQKLLLQIKRTILDYLNGETETDLNIFEFTNEYEEIIN